MYVNIDSRQILNINTETELQQAIVKYLRDTDLLYVATLGEFQDSIYKRIEGFKMGYVKGSCDLLILTPCSGYNFLALELKAPSGFGQLANEQHNFLDVLSHECNAYCLVSNDYTEIIEIIIKYINDML